MGQAGQYHLSADAAFVEQPPPSPPIERAIGRPLAGIAGCDLGSGRCAGHHQLAVQPSGRERDEVVGRLHQVAVEVDRGLLCRETRSDSAQTGPNWTPTLRAFALWPSVPSSRSSLGDRSLCDMGLSTDDEYFAPTFGAAGESSAACTMQADQALFLSPAGVWCIESDGDLADTACLDAQWNLTTSSVTIDGEPVTDLDSRRVDTAVQTITLPEDDIYGIDAGETELIARGQPAVVEDLAVGEHEIELAADFGNGEFAGSITITLTVEG